ncbi:MAG: hypothetical protein OZ948_09680 [Deltaproteobacteria bacterium]|nr:hypothetical protein [Deltaproteobacteria bacterium]
MQVFRAWWFPIAAAIALAVQPARALTLADLDAGGGFSVGGLSFSDFDVLVSGDVSSDLADYPVQMLADGFRLTGPLSVTLGGEATVLVSYVVEAAAGIEGAALFSPLVAVGTGAAALVSESLLAEGGGPLATLLALSVDGGSSDPSDAAGFAAVTRIEVVKVISLTGTLLAVAPHVDQRFTVVPEPLPLALLAGGLTGLAVAGRRREVVA